jgi:mannose-6-phosphate isomerase-like protein (cupin superfamily)
MKINDKLRHILDITGISVRNLHMKQKDLFPPKERLSYNALTRLFYGSNQPRFTTLMKISQLLEMPILELIEETEFDEIFFLRRNKRFDSFMYNDKAYADIVTSPNCSFMSLELHIQPGGKTRTERSPIDKKKKYEKCVYVVSGRLRVNVDAHEYNLTQRDSITFSSSQPHFFENTFKQRCIALITLSPKHF